MSKGSKQRPKDPQFITEEEMQRNWDKIFPNKKHNKLRRHKTK